MIIKPLKSKALRQKQRVLRMGRQGESEKKTLTSMFESIFSDNSNIMLAAIISLLLVILFVLLLHLYAKWFLAQAQAQAQARRRRTSVTVSDVLGPARFHHLQSFNIEEHHNSPLSSKGLDASTVRGIPLFVYEHSNNVKEKEEKEEEEEELECVICLSPFENGEVGRCLPKCGHAFHLNCIDMWLTSHSNCPICRAPILPNDSTHLDFVQIFVDSASQIGNGQTLTATSSSSSSFSLACSFHRMLGKVQLLPSSYLEILVLFENF
ncbi:RING-H2 finger protein ATL2, partial [Mucuna pruriens]